MEYSLELSFHHIPVYLGSRAPESPFHTGKTGSEVVRKVTVGSVVRVFKVQVGVIFVGIARSRVYSCMGCMAIHQSWRD